MDDFNSQLLVRGNGQDDNLIMIDNISIPFAFHFGGLTSVFDSDMIESAFISTGGFSARYGDKMASVISVRYKKGDTKK